MNEARSGQYDFRLTVKRLINSTIGLLISKKILYLILSYPRRRQLIRKKELSDFINFS